MQVLLFASPHNQKSLDWYLRHHWFVEKCRVRLWSTMIFSSYYHILKAIAKGFTLDSMRKKVFSIRGKGSLAGVTNHSMLT